MTFTIAERGAGAHAAPVRKLVGRLRVCHALACGLIVSLVACNGGVGSTVPPQPTATGSALATTGTAPTPKFDPTGILLVGVGEQVQARPPSEEFAVALSDAMQLAQANGSDLGYPWIDPSSGELVLSVVTPHGRELVAAASITVPHRTRDVSQGAAELRRIQDDVTFLHSRGVPHSELIYATGPDQRDNRVLIVISAMSPSLLGYLAAHYSPDALALQVDPAGAGGAPATTP
jgi:hypothetical protein